MLTNTLILYMTQEALTKARQRLQGRKATAPAASRSPAAPLPRRAIRRSAAKLQDALRH